MKPRKTMAELFAGVGGFRIGLEPHGWKTVFANQWEPGKKNQWAFDCYNRHFPSSNNSNADIAQVSADDVPDHALLVGGFPCQDYSVAATLAASKGIEGKKGVLWWQIRRIAEAKRPRYMLLENVDRLLKSPAKQRGRDFSIILSCLNALGYSVEWRVVNAADYGFVQRRRRTFIFATLDRSVYSGKTEGSIIENSGFFARTFPVVQDTVASAKVGVTNIPEDLVEISNSFCFPYENAGYCRNFKCTTIKVTPDYHGPRGMLGDILEIHVNSKYIIPDDKLAKWKYMKGAKREPRTAKTGYSYTFSEGAVPFPDPSDRPGRTMLTSEGLPSRTSHVVTDKETGKPRILTPVECERMNGFPDGWTEGMPERTRYFCMGNAMVCGLVERMGVTLDRIVEGTF